MQTSFPLFSRPGTTGHFLRTRYNDAVKRQTAVRPKGGRLNAAGLLFELTADALALALALRLAGRRVRPARILAGAAFGALAAGLTRRLSRGQTALLWLPVALGMMALGGGAVTMRRPLRSAMLLLCAMGLLGGTLQALLGATGSLAAAYAMAACAVPTMAACMRRARGAAGAQTLLLRFCYQDKRFNLRGIVDSGNTLRDYLTDRPIVVFSLEDGRRMGLTARGRLLGADTAGGRQLMLCFTPQTLELNIGGGWRRVGAGVALAPGLPQGSPALVPQTLIDECSI